jgi:regulator of replication initiation timing
MNAMKHTPEPWVLSRDKQDIFDAEGNLICVIGPAGKSFEHVRVANSSRIVACVNACKGLTIEEIEVLPPVKELASQLLKLNTELKKAWYAHQRALQDNAALKTENESLQQLNSKIDAANDQLVMRIDEQRKEVLSLRAANDRLAKHLEMARDTRNGLESELKRLKPRNLWHRIFNL